MRKFDNMSKFNNMIMSQSRSIQQLYFPDRFIYHIPIYSEMEILKYTPIQNVQCDIVDNHIYVTCLLQKFPINRIIDSATAEKGELR